MDKFRYIDKASLIDAIEVSKKDDFVTVYINSEEVGHEESVQKKFIREFEDILKDPNLHDPSRFHLGDHPRGSDWRTWENKYACHFHFVGDKNLIINELLARADLSKKLQEQLGNETF